MLFPVTIACLSLWRPSTEPASARAPLADPPVLSQPLAAIGASVSVFATYRDDAPSGTVFLYPAGTGNLGIFTAANVAENDDGQPLRRGAAMISVGDDSDAEGETTVVSARFRCIEQGLVYFVLSFVPDQVGAIVSTGASVLACGIPAPATPAPGNLAAAPAYPPPDSSASASLTATGGSRTFSLIATYRDDAPSGVAVINLASGPAHFTDAALDANNDGQVVRLKGGSAQFEDDFDNSPEGTSVHVAVTCDSSGPVLAALTFFADDGRIFSRNTGFSCDAPAPAGEPTLEATVAPAAQPCPPAPFVAAGPCVPAGAVGCVPQGSTVCTAIRPPSTGDAGLLGMAPRSTRRARKRT